MSNNSSSSSNKTNTQVENLTIGDEVVRSVEFREPDYCLTVLFILACICSCGILALICYWFKRIFLVMNWKMTTPDRATRVFVCDQYGTWHTSKRYIHVENGKETNMFVYKKLRFSYDETGRRFESVQFDSELPFFYYETNLSRGVHVESVPTLKDLNGVNSIEVPVPPLITVIISQALHPFIVFQIFSIVIWSIYDYFYYAILIAFMTVVSIVMQVISTRQNMRNLHKMTKFYSEVNLFRRSKEHPNGFWTKVSSTEIVPGDIFEITNGLVLSCDTLLLGGSQAVMNETMLTGESVPVVKTGIPHHVIPAQIKRTEDGLLDPQSVREAMKSMSPHEIVDPEKNKVHILFAGTKVVRVRGPNQTTTDENGAIVTSPALGIAIRIGFSTAKGQLVRSILFPKPSQFKFYTDSFKFIGVMGILAFIGFCVNAVIQYMYGEEILYIILRAGDLVTTAVPPTLPAVMAAGTSYAMARLKKRNIFCIDSQRVNMAGKVKVMCFDKTGTLTEEDLSVLGAMGVTGSSVSNEGPAINSAPSLSENAKPEMEKDSVNDNNTSSSMSSESSSDESKFTLLFTEPSELEAVPLIQKGMSCCHSVANVDGLNIGDPLDVKMFEFTKYSMIERGQESVIKDEQGEHTVDILNQTIAKMGIHSQFAQHYEALVSSPLTNTIPTTVTDEPSTEMTKHSSSQTVIGIVRRFEFSSHLQRASVIVQTTTVGETTSTPSHLDVFVKGSPEIITTLCDRKSVPANFESELSSFTKRGLRVIAFGYKTIPISTDENPSGLSIPDDIVAVNKLTREQVESDLTFLGFFILENKLRASTSPTLEHLTHAGIRSLMITGDNPLTAINVARECDLIPAPPLYVPDSAEEQIKNRSSKNSKSTAGTVSEPPSPVVPLDEYPVFLAEVDKSGNLVWTCCDFPEWSLNPQTLEPVLKSPSEQSSSSTPLVSEVNPNSESSSETGSVSSTNETDSLVTSASSNTSYVSANSLTLSVNTAATPSTTQTPNPASSPLQRSDSKNSQLHSTTPHFNPFSNWNGGPWGPLYWRGRTLPESFSSSPANQPPPSCYFLAVTGAAFRMMYDEEQAKIQRLNDLEKLSHNNLELTREKVALAEELETSVFKRVCYLAPVFARMSPDDKAHLVETLISIGFITGMCGDGANDCGALKAAHCGVSLSEVEASIAAPFTSRVASISCVESLILEGRAALSSSFQVFKTTATFAMIQLISVAILIGFNTMISDFQYLVLDILLTLPILFTAGYTRPSKTLHRKTPHGALVSFPVISSLFLHIIISFGIQFGAVLIVQKCSDFEPLDPTAEDYDTHIESFETTSIFLSSCISYMISGFVLVLYDKFLEPFFMNWMLTVALVFTLFVVIFHFTMKWTWYYELLQMVRTTDAKFFTFCIIAGIVGFIVLFAIEYFVCQINLPKRIYRHLRPQSKYSSKPVVLKVKTSDSVSHKINTHKYKKGYYALITEMERYAQATEA